jgi:hypothetical protein
VLRHSGADVGSLPVSDCLRIDNVRHAPSHEVVVASHIIARRQSTALGDERRAAR